ncbi:MAG: N-ethylammeline chlorohydrolase [Candidatus Melainabacteria bacterium GWF2_32_7]|nr:MAG: N-ethylammeline chlorohydrolase [Candidatus Melainabacteria bacterium GWF2_32_7]
MAKLLIKNATIITINPDKDILYCADILIEDNKISKIGTNISVSADKIIDAKNKIILPGFVQTHIHLCQTLFRGLAENRELLNWLREKIWPYEAVHDENSTYYSSLLGIGELISGGTTTILDMGGVNHTDKIFEAIAKSGLRAFAGKAMMDNGIGVPKNILETTENSIEESLKLFKQWQGAENNRINYAFAPRFILSCTDELFYQVKELSDIYDIPVHTHAYENKNEGQEVINLKGMREFEYFNKIGLLNEKFLAAHCVWVDASDIKLMKEKGVKLLHCPSSNFKLSSGTLNLTKLLDKGINVSIGADGAPCNNNLDMLHEIRTTALLQNVLNKPGAIEAHKYLELATIEGAKALGLDHEIGSIEEGKKADLVIMNLENDFHSWHSEEVDPATKIVYASKSSDIETVIIDGSIVMDNKKLLTLNKEDILENSKQEIGKLLKRVKTILSTAN